MTIREAKPAEFDGVMAFYYDLIDAMREAEYHPAWEKDIYPTRQFLYDSIVCGELFIAEIDDAIIGAMVINHDCAQGYDKVAWQIDADRDQVAVIHILAVSARHQGQGLAKEMVAWANESSRRKGMKAIRLDVLLPNKPAHKLYISMGFAYIDTIQLFYEDTGLTDFLLYELVI